MQGINQKLPEDPKDWWKKRLYKQTKAEAEAVGDAILMEEAKEKLLQQKDLVLRLQKQSMKRAQRQARQIKALNPKAHIVAARALEAATRADTLRTPVLETFAEFKRLNKASEASAAAAEAEAKAVKKIMAKALPPEAMIPQPAVIKEASTFWSALSDKQKASWREKAEKKAYAEADAVGEALLNAEAEVKVLQQQKASRKAEKRSRKASLRKARKETKAAEAEAESRLRPFTMDELLAQGAAIDANYRANKAAAEAAEADEADDAEEAQIDWQREENLMRRSGLGPGAMRLPGLMPDERVAAFWDISEDSILKGSLKKRKSHKLPLRESRRKISRRRKNSKKRTKPRKTKSRRNFRKTKRRKN